MRLSTVLIWLSFSGSVFALDVPQNQVLLEVKVAEVRMKNLSGEYTLPGPDFSVHLNLQQNPFGVITGQADVILSAPQTELPIPLTGQYSIAGLGAPKLKMSGKSDEPPASIKITGTATDTGVALTVKPKVDRPLATLTMELVPTILETGFLIDSITTTGQTETQVFGTANLVLPGQSPLPVLTRQTVIRNKDGIIIGGLFESDGTDFNLKIPFEGEPPAIMDLQKSKAKIGKKQNILFEGADKVQLTTAE